MWIFILTSLRDVNLLTVHHQLVSLVCDFSSNWHLISIVYASIFYKQCCMLWILLLIYIPYYLLSGLLLGILMLFWGLMKKLKYCLPGFLVRIFIMEFFR